MAIKNNNADKRVQTGPDSWHNAPFIFLHINIADKKKATIKGIISKDEKNLNNITGPTEPINFPPYEGNLDSSTLMLDIHNHVISILGSGFEIINLN